MSQAISRRDHEWRRAGSSLPRTWALTAGFAFVLVLVVLGPFMTDTDTAFSGEGNPFRQGSYLLAALIVAFGLRLRHAPGRLNAIPIPILIALGVCLLSIIWAIVPAIALRRLILTALVIWTVCASARNLGFDGTLRVVRVVLALALLVNYIVVIFSPGIGIHQTDVIEESSLVGDWRGIMTHKNFAGALCAITIIFFAFAARPVPKVLRAIVIVAAAIFLWFSQSKTSGGMAVAALVIAFLYLRYSARYRVLVISLACLGAVAGAVFVNIYNEPIGNLIVDPKAFTGRTLIWAALSDYVRDHPLLGSGYGSFWDIGPGAPIHQYAHGWVEAVASAHNGFLELVVQVGWPGTIVIAFCLVLWPLAKLITSSGAEGSRGALLLAAIIFCVGHNMTESSMLQRDSLVQVTLTLAIVLVWTMSPVAAARSAGADPNVFTHARRR